MCSNGNCSVPRYSKLYIFFLKLEVNKLYKYIPFRFVPYIGMVTLLMSDYPIFKASNSLVIFIQIFLKYGKIQK